jgi:phenylpropionate dioxygenase-like ring-hydroxylating dioxygenase large terminal subunit
MMGCSLLSLVMLLSSSSSLHYSCDGFSLPLPLSPSATTTRTRMRISTSTSSDTATSSTNYHEKKKNDGKTTKKNDDKKNYSLNQIELEKKYSKFPRTWVPIASIYELDPNRPTPQLFLNQQYVCYQDQPSGQWIIMDDSCPHRLAPLSEGRINHSTSASADDDDTDKKKGKKNKDAEIITSTSLQCSYHGWEYDGLNNGQCIGIPQISEKEKTALLSSTSNSNRACVKSYSTIVHKNILWFWPWKLDSLSILGEYKKYPEGIMESISINAIPSTYTRDLPYGWDTLVENLIDPAHIPFAHHNLQGKRKDAIPIYMSIPESFPNSDTTTDTDTTTTTTTDDSGGSKNNNDGDGETGFYFEWSDRTSKC